MSKSHVLLRALRLLHLYIGVFIAPALFFFAFTGAMQTFSLHETTSGSSYKPPAWAMTLAQIHKKQTPVVPPKKQPSAVAAVSAPHGHAHGDAAAGHDAGHTADPVGPASLGGQASTPAMPQPPPSLPRTHNPLPLKIFFLLVAIGLFTSTLTGLYMSWKYANRRRGVLAALFLTGIVIPLGMILI